MNLTKNNFNDDYSKKIINYLFFEPQLLQFLKLPHCFFVNTVINRKLFIKHMNCKVAILPRVPRYTFEGEVYCDYDNDFSQKDFHMWRTDKNQKEAEKGPSSENGFQIMIPLSSSINEVAKFYNCTAYDGGGLDVTKCVELIPEYINIFNWILMPLGDDDYINMLIVSEKLNNKLNTFKEKLKSRQEEISRIRLNNKGEFQWEGSFYFEV